MVCSGFCSGHVVPSMEATELQHIIVMLVIHDVRVVTDFFVDSDIVTLTLVKSSF
jgi:hypothetical protein